MNAENENLTKYFTKQYDENFNIFCLKNKKTTNKHTFPVINLKKKKIAKVKQLKKQILTEEQF